MSTSLSVNSKVVANATVPRAALRPLLGSYELAFEIQVGPTPLEDQPWWIRPQSMRVTVLGSPGHQLGIARPDRCEAVYQSLGAYARQLWMTLPLQPHQLSSLEESRSAGDLALGLQVVGDGGRGTAAPDPFQADFRLNIPRSDWIAQLKAAGAMSILLLEIPLMIGSLSSLQTDAAKQLQQAQSHFTAGNYNEAVAACRLALEVLGVIADPLNLYQGAGRNVMGKSDRKQAMLASLRHYTHPPHHVGSEVYSRDDARMTLHMTAAAVASGPF